MRDKRTEAVLVLSRKVYRVDCTRRGVFTQNRHIIQIAPASDGNRSAPRILIRNVGHCETPAEQAKEGSQVPAAEGRAAPATDPSPFTHPEGVCRTSNSRR